MEINTFSSGTNFKSNMPIFKVLKRGLNGIETEMTSYSDIRGPITALIKRIKREPKARETDFFRRTIGDFRRIPDATTTIEATNHYIKKYMIFGSDATEINDLRQECYRNENISPNDIKAYIIQRIILPIKKQIKAFRFKGDTEGESVGLVIHVGKSNGKYDFGLDIASLDGKRIYAQLPYVKSPKKTPVVQNN